MRAPGGARHRKAAVVREPWRIQRAPFLLRRVSRAEPTTCDQTKVRIYENPRDR